MITCLKDKIVAKGTLNVPPEHVPFLSGSLVDYVRYTEQLDIVFLVLFLRYAVIIRYSAQGDYLEYARMFL
jgi:hypothetical protein